MSGPTPDASRACRGAAFDLGLANLLVALWIGQAYLTHAPSGLGARVWIFLELALLSAFALLGAPLVLATVLAARMRLGPRAQALGAALVWTAFQMLVLTDTRVYNLFRYHLNAWVWSVVTTPGSDEAVHLDAWFWTRVATLALAILAGQLLLWRWRRARHAGESGPAPRWLRPGPVCAGLILPACLAEKAIFAHADLVRDREVISLSRLIPAYQRLTVKRLAEKWFGYELAERPRVEIGAGLLLRYPLEAPAPAPAARPNVVMIAVESLRADMLSQEVMPALWSFALGSRRFTDHASGGNNSRYGLFALLYGLHGSYWRAVYAEQRSPVLLDELQRLGYRQHVWCAASMSFPEMRSTAFARIEEEVEDRIPYAQGESRDAGVVRRFEAWLEEQERDDERPLFLFVFLDAPHQTYNVPDGPQPFEPYARDVDYLELSGADAGARAPEVFNRYKNSVRDADRSIAAMLGALERRGELDGSLVVVTGDHGEEFYEHGSWGHTSNFAREQVLVPMVLRGPGVASGVEARPTSHVDVAPTLLELLGADPTARGRWCLGESLLEPPAERVRVAASWDTLALWLPEHVVVVPMEAYRGSIDAYDYDWRPAADPDAVVRGAGRALSDLAEQSRRFLR